MVKKPKWNVKWEMIPLAILVLVLLSWLTFEMTGILTLEETVAGLRGMSRPLAALLIVLLLVADVFIPVPSTAVITLAGVLFGVVGGTVLTVLGSMLSSWAGFYIGRAGGRRLVARFVPQKELREMEAWVDRFGKWALLLARALPMMAETVAFSAGIGRMPQSYFSLYTFIGALIVCGAYVIAGDRAETVEQVMMILVAGFVVMLGLTLLVRRKLIEPAVKEKKT